MVVSSRTKIHSVFANVFAGLAVALASSYLRGPSILSMLFSALWEAVGPRRGRSPLTSSSIHPDFQPENRGQRAIKEGRFYERHFQSSCLLRRRASSLCKSRTPKKRGETTPQEHALAESCSAAFRGAPLGRPQLRFSQLAQAQVFCRCAARLWPATHKRCAHC